MRFLRSRHKSELSDDQIIRCYKEDHDQSWIGVLFERYSHLIYAVSFNYLKDEDECKDVVIHIFENLSKDLQRYEINYFSSWLHTVARNHCLRLLAAKKEKVPLQDQLVSLEEEEPELFSEFLPQLSTAIDRLNEDQKKCIELFYLKEMSYKDISELTGFSLNQVKSFIQNGKRNLKLILTNKK